MGKHDITVALMEEPDGHGFIYGQAWRGDRTFTINVMPPQADWCGQHILDGYEPHASDWIFYIDGNEVGRVSGRLDIEAEFVKLLGAQYETKAGNFCRLFFLVGKQIGQKNAPSRKVRRVGLART